MEEDLEKKRPDEIDPDQVDDDTDDDAADGSGDATTTDSDDETAP